MSLVRCSRLDDGEQRMQRAIGVPQREGRVVGEALRLVHGVVGAAVAAVAVHEERRRHQRVIERGVEVAPHRRRRVDLQNLERPRPLILRGAAHRLEIPARHGGGEVGERVVLAHRGDRHLHHQLRARGVGEVEGADQRAPLDLRAGARLLAGRRREALVEHLLLGVAQLMPAHRAREAHREVQLPPRRPAARLPKAADGAVGMHPQARPQHLAGVVVEAGAQVDEHVRGPARRKAVAVHADARRRR